MQYPRDDFWWLPALTMDKATPVTFVGITTTDNSSMRQSKMFLKVLQHMCHMSPPLCRSFPILQGWQQCRGTVLIMEVMAQHWTTYEVCELLSQSHMEDVVPPSVALTFLIKHGWSVQSCKAGHAGWNRVPKTWQRFVSGDISGSVQYQPKCPAGLRLGQGAQALICLGAW